MSDGEWLELRPEVLRFAQLMERKLRKNDHKGGWESEDPRWLYERFEDELKELHAAWQERQRLDEARPPAAPAESEAWVASQIERRGENAKALQGESADVANFLMMWLDRLDALPPVPPIVAFSRWLEAVSREVSREMSAQERATFDVTAFVNINRLVAAHRDGISASDYAVQLRQRHPYFFQERKER